MPARQSSRVEPRCKPEVGVCARPARPDTDEARGEKCFEAGATRSIVPNHLGKISHRAKVSRMVENGVFGAGEPPSRPGYS
jgi:hypothetical protein